MELSRLKKILQINEHIQSIIDPMVRNFYEKINLNGDAVKLIKEIGNALNVRVFNIPMKDDEFGAVSYKTKYSKYILLNSNQTLCKMNFSFYHDLYHIVEGSSNIIDEYREVHLNESHLYDEHECKANLFAANILMPRNIFISMYDLYNKQYDNNLKIVIFKLMSYFSSPYVSVVIRLNELSLLKDLEIVDSLLSFSDEDLKVEFNKLGISDEILKPTLSDDSLYLIDVIEKEGTELLNRGLISEHKYKNIISNINKLIKEIRYNG